MDTNREILDRLMGRDRNKTKDEIKNRDHYSNKDVCKSYLICFCFHTLFPNTAYDEGPCKFRHDPFLKSMFDEDLNRGEFEKQYLVECIAWIEKRLGEVETRVKKNLQVLEAKSSFSTERSKDVVQMLLSIDREIEQTVKQAEMFGQSGQIMESERCMNEVERLRERRKDVELTGDSESTSQKQQKICQICGAIQTINDTDKRITMHLQGKIHQGFLRLRHEIDTLRIRLDILNNLNKGSTPAQKERPEKQQKKSRSRSRRKSRSKNKDNKEKAKDKDHGRDRDHYKDKDRTDRTEKDKDKDKDRYQKNRDKERSEKDRDRDRDREKERERQRDRDRRDRSKDRKDKKKHKHDRSRSRDRYRE